MGLGLWANCEATRRSGSVWRRQSRCAGGAGQRAEFTSRIELPDEYRQARPFVSQITFWTEDCEVPDPWAGYYLRNGNVICIDEEFWSHQNIRAYALMAHEIAHAVQIRMDEINGHDGRHHHDREHFAMTHEILEELLVREAGMSRVRAVAISEYIKLIRTPVARLTDRL